MGFPRRLKISAEVLANFSAMMFIGTTLFMAYSTGQFGQLVSFKGFLFLIIGVLIAGLVIGTPLTRIHQRYAVHLFQKDNGEPSETTMKKVRFTGTFVMVLQILAVYYLTAHYFSSWLIG